MELSGQLHAPVPIEQKAVGPKVGLDGLERGKMCRPQPRHCIMHQQTAVRTDSNGHGSIQ